MNIRCISYAPLETSRMRENDFGPFFSDKNRNPEFEKMYMNYRGEFVAFVLKYFFVDKETVIDIFQDSILVLYKNIRSGKLTPENLKATLKTYLFSIGLYKLNTYFKDPDNDTSDIEEIMKAVETMKGVRDDSAIETRLFNEETKKIIRKEVMELSEPCNRILLLFYYERKSLKEIARLVGYKSEQVAKNKRLDCVKLLKKKIEQKYSNDDFFYE